jgi:hypothetical protein
MRLFDTFIRLRYTLGTETRLSCFGNCYSSEGARIFQVQVPDSIMSYYPHSLSALFEILVRLRFTRGTIIGASLCVCLLSGLVLFVSDHYFLETAPLSEITQVSLFLRDMPLHIDPVPMRTSLQVQKSFLTSKAKVVARPDRWQHDSGNQQLSRRLHSLRLASLLGPNNSDWLQRNEVGQTVLLDVPIDTFQKTWRGTEVTFRSTFQGSEHRDQLLSSMAEASVPLSCKLKIASEVGSVAELLQTSLSEFHLKQKEISWTVLAYTLYLPPQKKWANRFGEEFDFDLVANELIGRSLDSESCRGIHLVESLTILLRVDELYGLLQPNTRELTIRYLKERVAGAVASQSADGSWPVLWSSSTTDRKESVAGFTNEPTLSLRLTVASHLLEWFHYLPADLKPPQEAMDRGLSWLHRELRSIPEDKLAEEFCPASHSIRALDLAVRCDGQKMKFVTCVP